MEQPLDAVQDLGRHARFRLQGKLLGAIGADQRHRIGIHLEAGIGT